MRKKLVQFMVVLTMMSFFMFGCGNSEATTDTNTENEDVIVETPEKAEVEETQEEETVEAEESEAEEEPETEDQVEEEETEISEAQITAEVSTLEEVGAYAAQLDSKTPHIIIFNEQEGYLIDMKEGEHYQLKSGDRIFATVTNDMAKGTDSIPEKETKPMSGMHEIIPNYDEFESPQKALYKIWTRDDPDGEAKRITCYLYAPTE